MSDRPYEWIESDFNMGKDVALYCISLLERIVKGETLPVERLLRQYLLEKHREGVTPNVVRGLLHVGRSRQGFFFRMGISLWRTTP